MGTFVLYPLRSCRSSLYLTRATSPQTFWLWFCSCLEKNGLFYLMQKFIIFQISPASTPLLSPNPEGLINCASIFLIVQAACLFSHCHFLWIYYFFSPCHNLLPAVLVYILNPLLPLMIYKVVLNISEIPPNPLLKYLGISHYL